MEEAVILSACRTPIGKFLGSLSAITATELGSIVIREAVRRAGVAPEMVDEVIMGNVLSAGLGQAPARQAALGAGLPPTVGALTINKMCGSGLKAVMLADQAIRLGDARVVVAGGMESMSQAPYLLGNRKGAKFGNQVLIDSMLHDGLVCAFDSTHMGDQANYIASCYSISREAQDRYAVESQRRAAAAIESGNFRKEIVPVPVKSRTGTTEVSADEAPRPDTTLEGLSKLLPAFDPEGTVTSGNASTLSDGAAALVIASRSFAEEHGLQPLARIIHQATAGVEPKKVFEAPVPAIRQLLQQARLKLSDIDLFELNEAFAAQMLACAQPLELPMDKVNINGGGIALGHPIGASGARVLVTLIHAMHKEVVRRGVAALCLGGGEAVAMVVERIRPQRDCKFCDD